MTDFAAFANDSQVLTLVSNDDELSLENGLDQIVLSGTFTAVKQDPRSRADVVALRDALNAVLKALD